MNLNPAVFAAMREGAAELNSSFDAIAKEHGQDKAIVAMLMHTSRELVRMLKRRIPEDDWLLAKLSDHFSGLLSLIMDAKDMDPDELAKMADGIAQQCALLTADVKEAQGKPDSFLNHMKVGPPIAPGRGSANTHIGPPKKDVP